jgi:hypothetical protein
MFVLGKEWEEVLYGAMEGESAGTDQLRLLSEVCEGLTFPDPLLPFDEPMDTASRSLGAWLDDEFGPAPHSGLSAVGLVGCVIMALRAMKVENSQLLSTAQELFRQAAQRIGIESIR